MNSGPEGRIEGAATPVPTESSSTGNSPDTLRAVLQMQAGAGEPFEGTVEIGVGDPRAFHGWLELMGLLEAARSTGH
jgi:hypothetical protein